MPSREFFSADHHLFHSNIIAKCNRPWLDITGMNAGLRTIWNNTVRTDDIVHYVGDLSFSSNQTAMEFIRTLNGKIFLYPGNHDDKRIIKRGPFVDVTKSTTISRAGHNIHIRHYPNIENGWPGKDQGTILLHGHAHARIPATKAHIDVGIDVAVWGYAPLSFDQILAYRDTLPNT
jgi:calcineurin-like phosphoesterase family protein